MRSISDRKSLIVFKWEQHKRRIESGGFEPFCNAYNWTLARHHKLIAQKLERAFHEPGYNVIICMPPGHGKSRYASILGPAYFLKFPGKSVVMASHTAELAAKWGRHVKRIISEPSYKYFFKTELRQDSKAADRFELTNGSEYFACGMLGGVAGQRADLTILDDPVKSIEESESENMRDKVWDTFLSEFQTRAKPGASTVVMMTRRHEDDLIGRILSSPGKGRWDLLNLPAIAVENDPMGREVGDALWPEYIPLEMLVTFRDGLNKEDIRLWESLYQQNPTIETGDYFKKQWIKKVNLIPKGLNIYGASDYAVSAGRGDYTVHAIIGHDDKNDEIYVIDIWRAQEESNVWVEKFLDLAQKHKTLIWAEESGQIIKSLDPFIRKEMDNRKLFVYREQFTSATDKTVRSRSFQAYMAQGKVHILNDHWTKALERELLAFPSGKHDDQVDALGLIGRLLDDMRVRSKDHKKVAEYEFKSNMIMLPGLSDDVSKRKSTFRKI